MRAARFSRQSRVRVQIVPDDLLLFMPYLGRQVKISVTFDDKNLVKATTRSHSTDGSVVHGTILSMRYGRPHEYSLDRNKLCLNGIFL
jgi:hypothetical protein